MAETSWELSALEFVAAWKQLGGKRMPFPIAFREYRAPSEQDLDAPSHGDGQRHDTATDRLRIRHGIGLLEAIELLISPIVRVAVCGFEGPHSERMIRAHAAIGRKLSAVIVQAPGPRPDSGGDVVISSHLGAAASCALVAAMPTVHAGRHEGISLPRNRSSISAGLQAKVEVEPEDAAEFCNRPHLSFGEIAVSKAHCKNARLPDEGTVVQWIDYADDGRYLIRHSQQLVAKPASPGAVASEIDRLVRAELDVDTELNPAIEFNATLDQADDAV